MSGFLEALRFSFAGSVPQLLPLALAMSAAFLIVCTRRWHIQLSGRYHLGGSRQAIHDIPTPRIGGLAVFIGLLFGAIHQHNVGYSLPLLLLVTALPVFAAGMVEDVFHCVVPRYRLIAGATGALLAVSLSGLWIDNVGIAGVDALLAIAPIGILFTVFATTGVAHAFNLVDGLNGLSSGIAMIVGAVLTAIALSVGDFGVAAAASVILLSCAGFWVVNYPHGKIFLGDAGAYTVGHLLAWLAVILAMRHEAISTWAMLLVFLWPVQDTMMAIYRRLRKGRSASEPDRMHFHHVVMRFLEISVIRRPARASSNPIASLVVLVLAAIPSVAAISVAGSTSGALWLIFGFSLGNIALYRTLIWLAARRSRLSRLS